ncbi:hypothetical protein Ahy_B05g074369 [Arachis hypogaea]|uniref:Uncharacterized protein n=1 Tax=Arachis hypogaea TaxID=3818 RepID=A0A444YYN5_ARAHY|nr:hypothetical protein Ahy_B05g074369 [Arachis hypogaea]
MNHTPLSTFRSLQTDDSLHFGADVDLMLRSVEVRITPSLLGVEGVKVLSGVWFISTDGVAGNPGVNTVVNWFKIEKDGKDYNLSFCPSVCNCSTLCRALGIFTDSDGTKHLALSDQVPTFKVMFKKA